MNRADDFIQTPVTNRDSFSTTRSVSSPGSCPFQPRGNGRGWNDFNEASSRFETQQYHVAGSGKH